LRLAADAPRELALRHAERFANGADPPTGGLGAPKRQPVGLKAIFKLLNRQVFP
jgi:hypothetical protein